jgi:two-component system phosphate regulon sensor histidine kinase PhoR
MSKRTVVSSQESEETGLDHPAGLPSPGRSLNDGLAFHKFVIDSVPIAIVSMDGSLRITELNRWAERVTGYTSEEALGKQCRDILRSDLCQGKCPLKTILTQARTTVSGRTFIHNRGEKTVPVRYNAAALFGAEGKLIGGVEAFMDITNLVAMERERANFISMLAHDMRSSLTGIHGLGLRLLRKLDDLDKENERKYLEIITKEAANLESLIDDFLDFSRIETGRLKLNIRATSLDKELEELFETYRVRAAQHGIKLDLKIEGILPVIEVDTGRLHRVFANLLDNAIKFSGKKGTVTITARAKEREVMVAVTDEGIGIDPEDLPHIFDVFHRGRATGGTEGHGLGLATVKAIVEGHGGRVIVASQPDAGATFKNEMLLHF